MILLWGLGSDGPLGAVARELVRRGGRFAWLNQRRAEQQRVELALDGRSSGVVWSGDDEPLDLDDVTALFLRPQDAGSVVGLAAAGPAALARAHAIEGALLTWAEDTPALVVNRPSAQASNGSKPYQLALLEACGFKVPPTLVTTDPEAALAFCERHGEVIYKSTSSTRSIVARLQPAHRARLADVAACPTQLQAHIPGRDHRVHVIGDDIFATEIRSDADDYRAVGRQPGDTRTIEARPTTLPADVEARSRAAAAALRLPLAGIDLRRTPGGDWYCFEANPSPAFTYYERLAGQPLTAAVTSYLQRGARA